MARVPRSELPDEGIFHVGARGAGRIPIFLDDEDRRYFLVLLAVAVAKFEWRCYAFCLMGNHYHLVVEARREELSGGMQLLNGDHAQTFNLKYGRWGHLFGERFWSRLVESDEQLVNTCKYVLENPVRAGLC
jgi:putative transposase